jgi:hypothetical protein
LSRSGEGRTGGNSVIDCRRGRCRGETNSLLKSDGGAGGGSTGGSGLRCGDNDVRRSFFLLTCNCGTPCSTTDLNLASSSAADPSPGIGFKMGAGSSIGAGVGIGVFSVLSTSISLPLPPPPSTPALSHPPILIPSFSPGPSSVPDERGAIFQSLGNRSCLCDQSEYGDSRTSAATSGQSGPK